MPDNIGIFQAAQDEQARDTAMKAPAPAAPMAPPPYVTDERLLELWKEIHKSCFEGRSVFERQWLRNLYYVLFRQWIEWFPLEGRWKDKRLAKGIPKPVTNKCKETVQTIRAMFTAIKLGAVVRPVGADPVNVSAASTADELQPVLYEAHDMDHVLHEFDFWLIALGNAFMHTYLDFDIKHGMKTLTSEQCVACGFVAASSDLVGAAPTCPECGAAEFQPAVDPETGEPIQETELVGRPTTTALSPLEVAFNNQCGRFSDIPAIVRMRWRSKSYYENHPILGPQFKGKAWAKSSSDQSLQLYKSLANHNDLGMAGAYYDASRSESQEDGLPEYECWVKPTVEFPGGLVFRVAGDSEPMIIHLEEAEGLPGPFPYKDAAGVPLFPFAHAGYDHVGGRIWASSALDSIIQKQDQLNQLDSMILLIIQRMSNPVWLQPKGAEIQKFTGMPGLVIEWNPLTVGGNAKPERIAGEGPHNSLFLIREQYCKDIEELAGTFDILKGSKPSGVEAFSAMQLLVERSQARFASVFSARGNAYKEILQYQLELERAFGPDERTKAVMSPARTWTFQNFKKAQLQGSFTVLIEDGSAAPKTNLGMRAAIDHANMLGMVNLADPDQQYEGLKLFGLTKMVPSLDVNIQAALQKQQAFEDFLKDPTAIEASIQNAMAEPPPEPGMDGMPVPVSPTAATPLKWRPWYSAVVHKQEFLKWANSDRMRDLVNGEQGPAIEALLSAHLMEINMALVEQAIAAAAPTAALAPQKPGGGAVGMTNSNRESSEGNSPGGSGRPLPG